MNTSDKNQSIHIAKTGDGTTTLYSDQFGQHYHNPNGAVAESRHVFFETAGVPDMLAGRESLIVFETGFGTGLNLILMLDYLNKSDSRCRVDYYSIEAFPISAARAGDLDFGQDLAALNPAGLLQEVFAGVKPGWNRFEITGRLRLHLYYGFFDSLPEAPLSGKADLFYHDPFSPEVNSELWSREVFEKLSRLGGDHSVLVTYCAASSARAAMAAAGWCVARAPGALGKREMTIASPDAKVLTDFKRVNEERLKRRYDAGDFKR